MSGPSPRRFVSAVVGITFRPTFPASFLHIENALVRFRLGLTAVEPAVALWHDVTNLHDERAIAVSVDHVHVGYLPRAVAARLCPFDPADWSAAIESIHSGDSGIPGSAWLRVAVEDWRAAAARLARGQEETV